VVRRARPASSPREAAWRGLCDHDARRPPWEPLLSRTLKGLEDRDRRLAAELLTGVLRHRRWLDHVITAAAGRAHEQVEPPVWNLLRLGAFQLLFLDRVPEHAAVHETVEIANRHHARAAGFVNAALRAVQRLKAEGIEDRESGIGDRTTIDSRLSTLAIRHSLPDDIAGALTSLLPEDEWDAAARAMNDPGPLGLRFNPLIAEPEQTAQRLAALIGEPPTPHPRVPGAWTCQRSHLDALRPLLDEGALVIQDPASQLVSLLAAPRPGMRVADLCAAPGGKAAHLAALMRNEGSLIVTDRDKARLRETEANLHRLGVRCAEVVDWAMAEMLLASPEPDITLIDAPCSGWGTVRHKPDLKWRRPHSRVDSRESIVVRRSMSDSRSPIPDPRSPIPSLQRALLTDAASHLAADGVLIYSVCTFLPEETDDVLRGFLSEHVDFALQDAREVLPASAHSMVTPKGSLRTWPHRDACDGFFAARLIRGVVTRDS
jgi:16S rRNA (cytosine967-C5)-methyltransferase